MTVLPAENGTRWIDALGLQAHPEGGWFREVYRAPLEVVSPVVAQPRSALTHIYFMLQQGQVSRFHKVAHDEIWNHYQGGPLRLMLFDGRHLDAVTLGQEHFSAVVPGGVWQAAEPLEGYALAGCSVAPGFDFQDFTFLDEDTKKALSPWLNASLARFL